MSHGYICVYHKDKILKRHLAGLLTKHLLNTLIFAEFLLVKK